MAFSTTCHLIRIAVGFHERVESTVPEVIPDVITIEHELIALVVDRAFAGARIHAVLLLIFGIELGVKHSDFHFMFHTYVLFILFFTLSHAGLPEMQHCRIVSHISTNRLLGIEKLRMSWWKN